MKYLKVKLPKDFITKQTSVLEVIELSTDPKWNNSEWPLDLFLEKQAALPYMNVFRAGLHYLIEEFKIVCDEILIYSADGVFLTSYPEKAFFLIVSGPSVNLIKLLNESTNGLIIEARQS